MSNLTIRCPCGFYIRGVEISPDYVRYISEKFITYHRCPGMQ